jgi:Arc/MetJ-type ribon-helix-helix transcriptional regulator
MQQITVKLPDDTAELLEDVTEKEFGGNRSQAVRELLRRGSEYDDLAAENDRLRRQLQATNSRQEDVGELVEYVEEERAVQQRREERRQANIVRRAWWYLAGTPEDETTG